MASSLNTPDVLTQPIAENGDKNAIPATNDQSLGLMSQSTGFPQVCSERIADGGIAPTRADFNGAFNLLSRHVFFNQNGGVQTFRADVSTAIGGYPLGAILMYQNGSDLRFVRSLMANNTYNFVSTPSYIDDGSHWETLMPISKNISNWSSNVTNCITEIPQDINLTLSNGTLTLKAGSKVYVPNGAGVFDVRNITSDATLTDASGANNVWLIAVSANGTLLYRALANCTSGANATASSGFAYDTTANDIGWFTFGGTKSYSNVSFPICICSSSSSGFTSIDQVFNGFGYIGSTVFVLPGVKGLIPNGFNADGTLKNTAFTVSDVRTKTYTGRTWNPCLFVSSADTAVFDRTNFYSVKTKADMVAINQDGLYYVEDENQCYSWAGSSGASFYTGFCLTGFVGYTSGKITSLTPRTAFHAVDYSEFTEELAKKADAATSANINLSNLTSTGANISNWSSNVSNCLTNIPQDITCTITDINDHSTLTLKAGSKVYVPNGAGVFNAVTITSDMQTYQVHTVGWRPCLAFYSSSGLVAVDARFCFSGTSEPSSSTDGDMWYDTTNNVIKRKVSGSWVSGYSLPFCIAAEGVPEGIYGPVQVFNGFGYIGSTVFALPGVAGLIANGKNADGTLKSTYFKTTSVLTGTPSNGTRCLTIRQNLLDFPLSANVSYDSDTNYVFNSTNIYPAVVFDITTISSGTLSSFNPNTVFHAVDYNEFAPVAEHFIVETRGPIGANGLWYRKYNDGWVEQGGHYSFTNTVEGTVNFLTAFADTHYILFAQTEDLSNQAYADGVQWVYNKSTTGFSHQSYRDGNANWYACGKAA